MDGIEVFNISLDESFEAGLFGHSGLCEGQKKRGNCRLEKNNAKSCYTKCTFTINCASAMKANTVQVKQVTNNTLSR